MPKTLDRGPLSFLARIDERFGCLVATLFRNEFQNRFENKAGYFDRRTCADGIRAVRSAQ